MRTLDYFEFKLTDHDGNITYSNATQHILPPEIDKYIKIEQINHYTNGSQEILPIKPSRNVREIIGHTDKGAGFTHHDDRACCDCSCKEGRR